MPQQISPFLESKWGWPFGESGWNSGMDENLLKFSFMFDRNVEGIVSSLPAAVNGQAYFLTTDNRLYYAVGTTWYSSPTPKWFKIVIRSTGATYQFDGSSLNEVVSSQTLDGEVQEIQAELANLGTAAYEDVGFFATQASLDVVSAQANQYTDDALAPVLTQVSKLEKYTTPFDFGAVGDFNTDDTDAVNAAIADALTRRVPLYLNGDFGVTSVEIANASGLTVYCAGVLSGRDSGSYESVFSIKNCTDMAFIGRLVVSASYNTGYSCGVKVWSDTEGGCSLLDLQNISPVNAQLGWRIGDTAQPDRLLSEITVTGGHLFGCPSGMEIIGTQAVVSLVGSNIITGINGGPTGWDALPRIPMRVIGATVNQTAGELLLVDVGTGLAVSVEPIVSALYGNPYGTFVANGVCVESASQFAQARNPEAIPSPAAGSGLIQFDNCTGFHSQNSAPLIQTAADFTGRVSLGLNNFFSSVSRTQPNVQCANNTTQVSVNRHSFGRGFIQNLTGIIGGTLRFDRRLVLNATNLNGQALPNATQTTLIFTGKDLTGDLGRFADAYSTSTGIFTVPAGGLKDVEVKVQFTATGLTNGEVYLQVDGTTVGLAKANVYQSASFAVSSLNAGQQIKAVCFNIASGAVTAGSGATQYLTITASN